MVAKTVSVSVVWPRLFQSGNRLITQLPSSRAIPLSRKTSNGWPKVSSAQTSPQKMTVINHKADRPALPWRTRVPRTSVTLAPKKSQIMDKINDRASIISYRCSINNKTRQAANNHILIALMDMISARVRAAGEGC